MPRSAPPSPVQIARRAPRGSGAAARVGRRRGSDGPAAEAPNLRLAIGPAGLGIELAEAVPVACLRVTELEVAIPGVRFPLDVSGGVSRFRHRRGRLQRLVLELGATALREFLAPRLRGLLGAGSPTLWVSVRAAGATFGLSDPAATRILAFEVAVDASGDDLSLLVHGARGIGLPAPAAALAMRAVHAALGRDALREGSLFKLSSVSRAVSRIVLPDAGVRAPDAAGVRWAGLSAQADAWVLFADDGGGRADLTEEAARAREALSVTRAPDDALFGGDLDVARGLAVAALERAPRHRELSRRIADIDHLAGQRSEAALATMVESERASAGPHGARDGILVGELLAEVSDPDAAVAALVRAGEDEPVSPLASRAFELAAELTPDPHDALTWLDMAVARTPASPRARWARLARRLAAGRVEDALADAEHLEAQASGSLARHAVWREAGELWGRAGRSAEAATLYERALRFEPRDPIAIAGLGRALIASRRGPRGAALLARAVDLAAGRGEPSPAMVLELATALAEVVDDAPAAIARAREVPSSAPEAARARGLEGRWRSRLGDGAGASFAFAQMRELAEGRFAGGAADLVPLLVEAAEFERTVRSELFAAQRHLAAALRLSPRHEGARAAYARVGLEIMQKTPPAPPADPPDDRHPTDAPPEPLAHVDLGLPLPEDEPGAAPPVDEAEDTARADALIQRLHADSSDDAVVDELAERLLRLGRTHELYALLSARVEDATPERRAELIPRQRRVLSRLVADARAAGRAEEASLFAAALEALSS